MLQQRHAIAFGVVARTRLAESRTAHMHTLLAPSLLQPAYKKTDNCNWRLPAYQQDMTDSCALSSNDISGRVSTLPWYDYL